MAVIIQLEIRTSHELIFFHKEGDKEVVCGATMTNGSMPFATGLSKAFVEERAAQLGWKLINTNAGKNLAEIDMGYISSVLVYERPTSD